MKQQKENSSTDKRYTFAQRPGDDYSCIKIVEGKYKDVIYKYGKVQFAKEENADGKLPLQFEWTLLKKPEELEPREFLDTSDDGESFPDIDLSDLS